MKDTEGRVLVLQLYTADAPAPDRLGPVPAALPLTSVSSEFPLCLSQPHRPFHDMYEFQLLWVRAMPCPSWCPVHGSWPKLEKHLGDKKKICILPFKSSPSSSWGPLPYTRSPCPDIWVVSISPSSLPSASIMSNQTPRPVISASGIS